MFFKVTAYSSPEDYLPTETIFFKLPGGAHKDWKEISRIASKKEVIVGFILSGEKEENWSEALSIVYRDRFHMNIFGKVSIDTVIENIQLDAARYYVDGEVVKMLENDSSTFIYERKIRDPSLGDSIIHEIARVFLVVLNM
jgi:hypothetical protein